MAQRNRKQPGPAPARQRTTVTKPAREAGAGLRRTVERAVRRRPLLIVALLVVLHITFGLLTFQPQPHTGGDNAAYITLARSLLANGMYTELWEPGQPPHTKYPPIFPAVIALAMTLGLRSWVQLKLVVLALSSVAVAFSFLWMRARRRGALALGVGVLLAIAPGVLNEGHWVLSDVPFWAFTMVAVWAFERLRRDDWKRFALGAIAILFAYFTRSAGLPLAIAALAFLAWRRRWPQLIALALLLGIPAILWWLRARAFGPSGYVSEFWLINPYIPDMGRIGAADLVQRMIENAGKYISIHLPVLLALQSSAALVLLSAVIFLFAIVGWARRIRHASVAVLFVPLYIGLILIWPAVWSGERFLLPALPFVLFFAGQTLTLLFRRFARRAAFGAGIAATLLLLVAAMPALNYQVGLGRECVAAYRAGEKYPCLPGDRWRDFFAFAERTSTALPQDAVVLSRKPRLFYVLSNLPGRIYPLHEDPVTFFATVDSVNARYVLLDRVDAVSNMYLVPVLLRTPAAFCLMRASAESGTALFGILPGHNSAPDRGEAGLNDADNTNFPPCGPEFWRSADAERAWSGS
jgi:hypothetical protein